ncbi:sucrose-6-phosphate hydrolase SacC (GH32 family) [Salana multivorans]|uniref:beta-fructofuranosidase n=1 Tax=Salana multivorans TaxID=120377 RepID=A0A3N2DAC8_9MICO|nr:glycoside hydrolase family 32 protein [Salana multivorans]ROR96760.1 sucrose-6-phosphate hydrolase SacC (GH32 family) [Salana multivorans]
MTTRTRAATTDPACDQLELAPGERARTWVAPTVAGGPPGTLLAVASGESADAWWVLGIDRDARWVLRRGDGRAGWTDHPVPARLEPFTWALVDIAVDADGVLVVTVSGEPTRLPAAGHDGAPAWRVRIGVHGDRGWSGPLVDGRPWYDGFVGLCGRVEVGRLADGEDEDLPAPTLDPRSAWPPAPLTDLDRPRWHFSPPTGWMNEPHGALHHGGRHHLFYQRNELGPFWGAITWGHAVSDDLVTWRDVGHALEPHLVPCAPDGIWSGSSAKDAEGSPYLFFTGGDERDDPNQRTVVARPVTADLSEWVADRRPVTTWHDAAAAAAGLGLTLLREFRDPFVWREGEEWFQLVGTGVEGRGGTAFLFAAPGPDGPWDAVGPLLVGDAAAQPETGVMWELPGLVPIGRGLDGVERHLFLVSPWWAEPGPHWLQYVWYWVGVWDRDARRFRPDDTAPRSLDVGGYLTGGTLSVTEDGRVLLWSITQDLLSDEEHRDRGWAGGAGLPLELSLREGLLAVAPVREVTRLRDGSAEVTSSPEGGAGFELSDGAMWELEVDLDLPRGGSVVVAVRPGGDETTRLTVTRRDDEEVVLHVAGPRERPSRHVGADLPGRVRLRVMADHSLVEAFLGDRVVATTRAWARPGTREGAHVDVGDGAVVVGSRAWRLRPAPVLGDRRETPRSGAAT